MNDQTVASKRRGFASRVGEWRFVRWHSVIVIAGEKVLSSIPAASPFSLLFLRKIETRRFGPLSAGISVVGFPLTISVPGKGQKMQAVSGPKIPVPDRVPVS